VRHIRTVFQIERKPVLAKNIAIPQRFPEQPPFSIFITTRAGAGSSSGTLRPHPLRPDELMHADVDFFPVFLFFRGQRPGGTDHFATKETGSRADELAVFWVRLRMDEGAR
jgi:hypothetical protein